MKPVKSLLDALPIDAIYKLTNQLEQQLRARGYSAGETTPVHNQLWFLEGTRGINILVWEEAQHQALQEK